MFQTLKRNCTTVIRMPPQELLSWNVPYSDKRADHLVMLAIMGDELPEKPEESGDPRIFNVLWGLFGLCWSEKSVRPTASESMGILTEIVSSRE